MIKKEDEVIKLSPSLLNLYLECPRCFWLQVKKKIKRPEPPSSTLPNGIDLTLKKYFDYWRIKNKIPPILKGKLSLKLLNDQGVISRFRSRSFYYFDSKLNAYLVGILDDALEFEDGSVVPLDNKTRGFPPTETHFAHVIQMSVYTLLLLENGFKTLNLAYLIYWYFDHKNMSLKNPLEFNVLVEEVKTEPEKIKNIFEEAVNVLHQNIPPLSYSCNFCQYVEKVKKC